MVKNVAIRKEWFSGSCSEAPDRVKTIGSGSNTIPASTNEIIAIVKAADSGSEVLSHVRDSGRFTLSATPP